MTYNLGKLSAYLLWRAARCADLKGRCTLTCDVPVDVPRIITFRKDSPSPTYAPYQKVSTENCPV